MTPLTDAEAAVLAFATKDTRKFAVGLDYNLGAVMQKALESLQISERIRLIDVSPTAATGGAIARVFMITKEGEKALREHRKKCEL